MLNGTLLPQQRKRRRKLHELLLILKKIKTINLPGRLIQTNQLRNEMKTIIAVKPGLSAMQKEMKRINSKRHQEKKRRVVQQGIHLEPIEAV